VSQNSAQVILEKKCSPANKEGNFSLCKPRKEYRRTTIKVHSFKTAGLDGMNFQLQASAALFPEIQPPLTIE